MNQPWVHMCPLILNPLPPPSSPHPSGLSQSTSFECPASCIELTLVIYFTYGNIHVSVLFSQISPPSPSPRVQKSVLYICVSFAALHIEWSKSERETPIQYINAYIWNLERQKWRILYARFHPFYKASLRTLCLVLCSLCVDQHTPPNIAHKEYWVQDPYEHTVLQMQ